MLVDQLWSTSTGRRSARRHAYHSMPSAFRSCMVASLHCLRARRPAPQHTPATVAFANNGDYNTILSREERDAVIEPWLEAAEVTRAAFGTLGPEGERIKAQLPTASLARLEPLAASAVAHA